MKQRPKRQLDLGSIDKVKQFANVLNYYGLLEYQDKYKVVCPFHEDVNASMLIDVENASFYCFGCGKFGNVYDFIKYMNPKLKPKDINKKLREILSSGKVGNKIELKRTKKKRNMIAVRDHYYNLSKTDWNDIKTEDGVDVFDYLSDRGFTANVLNLVRCKVNESTNYPIIFPMFDMKTFKGYVCRTMDSEVEKKRKYLYNTGFRRVLTLAGKYDNDVVILVEGFLDKVKAQQFGIKKVAAILGWKISKEQVKKLKRKGVKKIICALDNDEAGNKGYKYLKELKEFEVVRLRYPKGVKDFGDVTKTTFKKIKNQITKHGGF